MSANCTDTKIMQIEYPRQHRVYSEYIYFYDSTGTYNYVLYSNKQVITLLILYNILVYSVQTI